jgi:hypothetical protein
MILFGLVSEKGIPTNLDLINEFFRLLRPNGNLIIHMDNSKQTQTIDHFKMCGFTDCSLLNADASFLIDHKTNESKRLASLWSCQKPSFDIGYSVSLRNGNETRSRQVASSLSTNGKKTWTVDDDDLIDTDELLDDNDRKKPDVKSKSSIAFVYLCFIQSNYFQLRT